MEGVYTANVPGKGPSLGRIRGVRKKAQNRKVPHDEHGYQGKNLFCVCQKETEKKDLFPRIRVESHVAHPDPDRQSQERAAKEFHGRGDRFISEG